MIASLPMYTSPRTGAAEARFWALIRDGLRARGITAPDTLAPAPDDLMAHWCRPDLVLSQTCGLPFRKALIGQVTLVGTPDYALEGCPPGHYRSLIVARATDPRDHLDAFANARFAFNDPMSQSGWAAVAMELPQLLGGRLLRTGSHLASLQAVQSETADFAAIDAVSWRHFCAATLAQGLQVIHATQPTPGLPLITAKGQDPALIRAAVADAIAALPPQDRDILGLRAIIDIPQTAYELPLPPGVDAFLG